MTTEKHRLSEEASEWFLRRRANPAPEIDTQFDAWCAGDPERRLMYEKVERTWNALGAKASAPEVLLARGEALRVAHRTARHRMYHGSEERHWLRWGVTISAAAACLALVVWFVGVWQSQYGVRTYQTAVGETRTLTLPDDSKVTLDAGTRVKIAFSAETRLVELSEGQAQFDVASDSKRVFKVKVANETVVAHGTAFNIEHRDGEVSVTLLKGRVTVTQGELSQAGQPGPAPTGQTLSHELTAGDQLVTNAKGEIKARRQVDLDRVTAWRSGKIIFQDEPLRRACAQMNKYSRIKIDVQDEGVGSLRVNGILEAGSTAAFVGAVESLFSIKGIRSSKELILLVRGN